MKTEYIQYAKPKQKDYKKIIRRISMPLALIAGIPAATSDLVVLQQDGTTSTAGTTNLFNAAACDDSRSPGDVIR